MKLWLHPPWDVGEWLLLQPGRKGLCFCCPKKEPPNASLLRKCSGFGYKDWSLFHLILYLSCAEKLGCCQCNFPTEQVRWDPPSTWVLGFHEQSKAMGAELLTSEGFGTPFTYSFGHIYLLGWGLRGPGGTPAPLWAPPSSGAPRAAWTGAAQPWELSPKSHSGAAGNGTGMRLRKAQASCASVQSTSGIFQVCLEGQGLAQAQCQQQKSCGCVGP